MVAHANTWPWEHINQSFTNGHTSALPDSGLAGICDMGNSGGGGGGLAEPGVGKSCSRRAEAGSGAIPACKVAVAPPPAPMRRLCCCPLCAALMIASLAMLDAWAVRSGDCPDAACAKSIGGARIDCDGVNSGPRLGGPLAARVLSSGAGTAGESTRRCCRTNGVGAAGGLLLGAAPGAEGRAGMACALGGRGMSGADARLPGASPRLGPDAALGLLVLGVAPRGAARGPNGLRSARGADRCTLGRVPVAMTAFCAARCASSSRCARRSASLPVGLSPSGSPPRLAAARKAGSRSTPLARVHAVRPGSSLGGSRRTMWLRTCSTYCASSLCC
jgi:hypothetical protein